MDFWSKHLEELVGKEVVVWTHTRKYAKHAKVTGTLCRCVDKAAQVFEVSGSSWVGFKSSDVFNIYYTYAGKETQIHLKPR